MGRRFEPNLRDSATNSADLRLAEIVLLLSLAIDTGMGQPLQSALRTCLLAVNLGQTLGLDEVELADVYYLALLRFAGCTADSHVAAMAVGDEIDFHIHATPRDYTDPVVMMRLMASYVGAGQPTLMRVQAVVRAFILMIQEGSELTLGHCEVAQSVARRLGLRQELWHALGQVFERWDGRGQPDHLKGEAIARPVRIVQLAQDVEIFHRIGGTDAAVAMARKRAGAAYDPALVDRFCRQAVALCRVLDAESSWDAALEAEPGLRPALPPDRVESAAHAIADFADLKTPYTVGHSTAVAVLASAAARHTGLPEYDVLSTRLAGYLHDLGRVGITAAIWCKPGPLMDSEWERVRLHPYYTERILLRSRPLSHLAPLAAMHSERLDGSGYHRGVPALMLSPAGRLLAVADVYHAMIEPRPHRAAYQPEVAAAELWREVRAGRLDGEAVAAVLTVAGHRVRSTRREFVAGLSEREVEVLRLVARGFSNRQIGAQLHISTDTAHHHVRHIYNKIGVSTRAAAAFFAMQHNLVQDASDLTVR